MRKRLEKSDRSGEILVVGVVVKMVAVVQAGK
jgi:hypothetical protein